MTRLAMFLATTAYVGYAPVAPGTFGSAAGLAVFYAVRTWGTPQLELLVIALVLVLGVWSAHVAEGVLGKDPGPVVIDEVAGMLMTLALLPVSLPGAIAGFLVFRVLDIVKPWPAGRFEALPGGFGIMADDAMAGIAEAAVAAAFEEVLLFTADQDLLGMVSDRVRVLRPRPGGGVDSFDPAAVLERSAYRVSPGQVAALKALIGDATDGYGGVRGIGPTVGPALIRRFGSLDALYDRLDEVEAAAVRRRLAVGRDDAYRCLDLATLRRDAPLTPSFDPEAGRVGAHDRDRLAAWLTAIGLADLLRTVDRIPRAAP